MTSEGCRLLVAGLLVASGRNASPRFAPLPAISGAAISFMNSSNLVRTERLRHRGITMGAATRRIKVARPWTALRGCPSAGGSRGGGEQRTCPTRNYRVTSCPTQKLAPRRAASRGINLRPRRCDKSKRRHQPRMLPGYHRRPRPAN